MSRNSPLTDPSGAASSFVALLGSLTIPSSPGEIRDASDRRTMTTSSQGESLVGVINSASLSDTIFSTRGVELDSLSLKDVEKK